MVPYPIAIGINFKLPEDALLGKTPTWVPFDTYFILYHNNYNVQKLISTN